MTQWWISGNGIFVVSFPVTWLILIFRDTQLFSLKTLKKDQANKHQTNTQYQYQQNQDKEEAEQE